MLKEKDTVFNKSKLFAIRIIKLFKYLTNEQKEHIMSSQIMRSGTSIGANLSECIYAMSQKDFLTKTYIALKECNETLYWLDLLVATNYITTEQFDSLVADCDEIRRMLSATTKTVKDKLNMEQME